MFSVGGTAVDNKENEFIYSRKTVLTQNFPGCQTVFIY